jgi:hypothetical protein
VSSAKIYYYGMSTSDGERVSHHARAKGLPPLGDARKILEAFVAKWDAANEPMSEAEAYPSPEPTEVDAIEAILLHVTSEE